MLLGESEQTIADLSLNDLWEKSVSSKPEIIGGSLVVASASLAIALVLMPLKISHKKSRSTDARNRILSRTARLEALRESLLLAAENDLTIFNDFRSIPNLKRSLTDPQYLDALVQATNSPIAIAELLN